MINMINHKYDPNRYEDGNMVYAEVIIDLTKVKQYIENNQDKLSKVECSMLILAGPTYHEKINFYLIRKENQKEDVNNIFSSYKDFEDEDGANGYDTLITKDQFMSLSNSELKKLFYIQFPNLENENSISVQEWLTNFRNSDEAKYLEEELPMMEITQELLDEVEKEMKKKLLN